VLYSFSGGIDGYGPNAGVIMDSSGSLYSTTEFGGTFGVGVAFKLTPPSVSGGTWTETVLHSFAYSFVYGGCDGAFPRAALIMDVSGALYGTTWEGGFSGAASCSS
jgi:hypothetical protein